MGYGMNDLIPVVARLAEKYVGGDSTSVTYEKAEQLMEAVLYCIHESKRRHRRYMKQGWPVQKKK